MDGVGRQVCGQLGGELAHALRRDDGVGAEELLQHDVEHAVGGRQRRIELDAADKGTEEAVDHGVAVATSRQAFTSRRIGLSQQLGGVGAAEANAILQEPELVEEAADRRQHRRRQGRRLAERVAEQCELLADPNECAGIERAEIERVDVELTVEFGVGPQQDLETAVEDEAVDNVAADPPADAVRRLEHDHRAARLVQDSGGGKAGETGTDDDDVAGLGKGRLIGHVDQARR